MHRSALALIAAVAFVSATPSAQAPASQRGAAGRGGRGGPAVVSPEVGADRTITFRYLAPNASMATSAQ